MSLSVAVAALFASVVSLVWLALAMKGVNNKNKELQINLDLVDKQMQLLRDSQLGLGRQLLALERALLETGTQGSPAESAQSQGPLHRIAAMLRAGSDPADIQRELGVSDSEVGLVEMILRNADRDPLAAETESGSDAR